MLPIKIINKSINLTKSRNFVTVPSLNPKVNSQAQKPLPSGQITRDEKFSEQSSDAAKLEGMEQQELSDVYKIKSEFENRIQGRKVNLEPKSNGSKLEGIERHQDKQKLSELNKIKAKFEKKPKDITGMTPSEAANKVLDESLSKTRPYLGNSMKFIEYPLKNYARTRLEQMFTFLAEDGRVNENIVDNLSYYALQLFFLLAATYLWEKQRSQKDAIKKLEGELEELEERYGEDVHTHDNIREKIIKQSEKLLKYTQEATKYENILSKLKEAEEAASVENVKQTKLEYVKESVSSIVISSEQRQWRQVNSFLKTQLDSVSKQTERELEKIGRVNSLVIKSEDKIDDLNKKIDKTKNEIEKLNTSANMYADHLKYTGMKHDEKVMRLKNTWGYSFFSQYKEKSDEENSKRNERVSSPGARSDLS